jgi:predicted AAA+ superfamily ATPase
MWKPIERRVPRRILTVIQRRLQSEPVVALVGSRTVGKSTLLREVAAANHVQVIDLDDLRVRAAVAADPSLFVEGPGPICIDEYQHVPRLLDAIKARLNSGAPPGSFVLTGSTRIEALPRAAQSLTGRLHVLSVLPLAQAEMADPSFNFLEVLLDQPDALVSPLPSSTTRTDYIDRVVAGGMPMALTRRTIGERGLWFDDYLRLTVERDALEISKVRQRDALPRLLRALAGQTAQMLNMANASGQIGLERSTGENYTQILESVFMLYRLPAWGRTLSRQVRQLPKLHVCDSGIAARLMRVDAARLSRLDPTSISLFGHLLETFVMWELLKLASWTEGFIGFGHWHTRAQEEVDLVLEREDGRILAFEMKAGSELGRQDERGLRALRRAVGDAWLAGVVLYGGRYGYRLEEGLYALPVDRLWRPG